MKTKDPQPVDPGERRRELNRRLRAAFIEGAEGESRRTHGRGLTDEELRRALHWYPGDLSEE